jgi:hypothetical protein
MAQQTSQPETLTAIIESSRCAWRSKLGTASALGICCLAFLLAQSAQSQTYNIAWYKIAGGGGTSSNAPYSISGTIGQPDAGVSMSGGGFTVTGGFWSIISVVQTAGLPNLSISRSGASVLVSWPDTGNYTLQQTSSLAVPPGWATTGYTISTSNGTNSITITSPVGKLFFRLKNP